MILTFEDYLLNEGFERASTQIAVINGYTIRYNYEIAKKDADMFVIYDHSKKQVDRAGSLADLIFYALVNPDKKGNFVPLTKQVMQNMKILLKRSDDLGKSYDELVSMLSKELVGDKYTEEEFDAIV